MTKNRKELFTERVSAGRRTYYFDVKESDDETKYLVISESRATDGGFEHDRVMVFEENLEAFYAAFEKTIDFIRSGKAYSVENIRNRYPKAYSQWTIEEDEALRLKYQDGSSVSELADFFQRQPGAIKSRLSHLGIR